MFERLEKIVEKFQELKEELTKPEVLNDYNKLKTLSKEQSDLEETVNVYLDYKETKKALEEAKTLINDEDFREIALVEVETLSEKLDKLYKELELLLVPKDENDGKNVIMEIRGAAGGDEANIFAGDLFRMYSYYAEENGWRIEVLNSLEGTSGGFSQIECMIKGENVYSKLKYENGSHRVQRVPATETQGRVHTSTATVLVMPEVEAVDIEIRESDLKIDVFHSSGAGGQSVNTANSAVRITHVPTGVVVGCQTERSQLKNKENAMKLLRIKLHDAMKQKHDEEVGTTRKTKIGTGDRSEKINFSIMELDRVMDGNLSPIIEALINEDMRLKLAGENFNS